MELLDTAKIESRARDHLAPSGFELFGWFCDEAGETGLLIGNVGSRIWSPFSNSEPYLNGVADPLNTWTRDIIDPLAESIGAEARYPFGDAVWPFQQWAIAALGVSQSPMGLLIHPEYGLWFALRAALMIPVEEIVPPSVTDHPCESCDAKPCLSSCPVGAFSPDGYDVPACVAHIGSSSGYGCVRDGCLARSACPVGTAHMSESPHMAFHMRAFKRAVVGE
ncbi:MAG: hypothetical protein AAF468_07070 [Pseudomonadota bacterium]